MTTAINVSVQEADFDVAKLQLSLLAGSSAEGAVATFTGYVRGDNETRQVSILALEHYPGMTERSIVEIISQARDRWPLFAATVVHRVGRLYPGDQIVWVGVSSSHREAAFNACEFIMDYLKTQAPFWKKETGSEGENWVSAKVGDHSRVARWSNDSAP